MEAKTPRERRRARTRQAILEAAREIIAEQGPEGLSMRELANRIEYSPSGLYEYYASKEELLDAVIDEGLEELSERIAHAPRGETTAEWLLAIGKAYLAFARENARLYVLMFDQVLSPSGLVTALEQLERNSAYGQLRNCLRTGVERGEFHLLPDETLEQQVYNTWALVHGLSMLRLTRLSAVEDIDAINQQVLQAAAARLCRT